MPDTGFDNYGAAMPLSNSEAQAARIAKQLDSVAVKLHEAQVSLSNLALRYEYIMLTAERDQAQVASSIKTLSNEIDSMHTRLEEVERTMWKFSGVVITVVFLIQIALNFIKR